MTGVVLIEPDEPTRELAYAYLSTTFTVTAAADLTAGWLLLSSLRPAAVVVDAEQFFVGGEEDWRVFTRIMPVIVTAGHLSLVPGAFRAGAHAVLAKPFSPVRLLARIMEGLKRIGTPGSADLRTCPYCWERTGVRIDEGAERRSRYRTCASCAKLWRERAAGGRRRTDWTSVLEIASPRPLSSP
jgi:DNA-binding response OmpR family regulator